MATKTKSRVAIRPLHDKILVERDEVESVTSAGIFIPESSNTEKPQFATVIAVGKQMGISKRGIRIGSAKDGFVTAFIPDPEPDQDNSGTSGAEGVAVDAEGNVYGAEVGPKGVKKYVLK